jgi:hypothetical protein
MAAQKAQKAQATQTTQKTPGILGKADFADSLAQRSSI